MSLNTNSLIWSKEVVNKLLTDEKMLNNITKLQNDINNYNIFSDKRLEEIQKPLDAKPPFLEESITNQDNFLDILAKTGCLFTHGDTDESWVENKHLEDIITQIRESFNGSIKVYTQGSCIKFCMILKTIFPQGIIYYNSDHAIFNLNNKFYDITGEVCKLDSHIPIEEFGLLKCYELMNLKYSI